MALLTHPNPIRDYLHTLTPPPSVRDEICTFNPEHYYVTTGDALMKLDLGLVPALKAYQEKVAAITRQRSDSPSVQRFAAEVDLFIAAVPRYREALLKIKGPAVHLETSRNPDDVNPHRVRPVDPRKKQAAPPDDEISV